MRKDELYKKILSCEYLPYIKVELFQFTPVLKEQIKAGHYLLYAL